MNLGVWWCTWDYTKLLALLSISSFVCYVESNNSNSFTALPEAWVPANAGTHAGTHAEPLYFYIFPPPWELCKFPNPGSTHHEHPNPDEFLLFFSRNSIPAGHWIPFLLLMILVYTPYCTCSYQQLRNRKVGSGWISYLAKGAFSFSATAPNFLFSLIFPWTSVWLFFMFVLVFLVL